MCGTMKVLYLLLQKNFIVRKRRWIGSIFEFLSAFCIIAIILAVRTTYDVEPMHIEENTYFPVLTKADIIQNHIPRSILHLYYRPRNNFTDQLMGNVIRCTNLPRNQLSGFDAEDDMLRSYEIQQGKDQLISVLAIDFADTSSGAKPKKLTYTIRSSRPIPEKLFDFEGFNGASDDLINRIPIVALQMCLNDAFIDGAAADGAVKPTVVIQKMPFPPYDMINPSEVLVQTAVCIFGGMIFLATIYLIPAYVSAEKTNGVNTLLKTNGVTSCLNFLSWLLSGMLFNVLPIVAVTVILKSSFVANQKPFYLHSAWSIIWLALFINVTHVYAFCLHVASYFCRTWLAQIVATTLPIFVNIIAMQLENTSYFTYVPYLGIFCPTLATTRIFDELNKRENEHTGVQWGNLLETAHPTLNITGSLGFIMWSSIMGIILHFLFAVYLDAVLPSKYGVPKPPFFFLKFVTNFFTSNKVCCHNKAINDSVEQRTLFEPVTDGSLTPGIKLRNLVKCFTCGCLKSQMKIVKAVRGINLDFYRGQITALLGQNGAGKTTTLSILTGLTAPSSGTVLINEKDIVTDLAEIQSDMGVCSQENTVFPDLTVLEQLRLVGLLKQKSETEKQIIQNVDDMLEKLNLSEKRNVIPDKLSGGQKRRLCLGMALIGNASTIFLDEPTSGMDPETSRRTWDLILKHRKQKTIIITTHSMEEADILGDRIAIMQSGKMKCYGSPMYLKKLYGHNYHEVTLSTTPSCNEEKIQELVGSAKMNTTHHGRIVISIPFSSSLPEILDNMEDKKAELGITGISVSLITLEQVFLRAAEENDGDKQSANHDDGTSTKPLPKTYLKGSELTRQKIKALIMKKLTYLRANKDLFVAMICGALLAVLLPVLCCTNKSIQTSSRLLDLGLYQSPEALIYSEDQMLRDAYQKIIEAQGGTGTLVKANQGLSNELLSRAVMDTMYYKMRMIISGEFNSSSSANGFYSGDATFSAPITVNAMSNLVLKTVAGNDYSIVASIGDLPQTLSQDARETALNTVRIIIGAILFITVFIHVVALFVKHPLLENSTKVKQLQQMTGVSSFLYWGTTFVVDYAFYILITLLMVFGMWLVDFVSQTNYISLTEIGVLLLLFLLFGINALLFAYVHSFIKKRFHVVYSMLSGLPLFYTFVMIAVHKLFPYGEDSKNASFLHQGIFLWEPHVSFVFGLMESAEIASNNARCRGMSNLLNEAACAIGDLCCDMKCYDGHCANPLPYLSNVHEDGGIEHFLIYLLLTPIILVGILCLLEAQAFAKLHSKFLSKRMMQLNTKGPNKEIDIEVEKEKSIIQGAINQRATDSNDNDKNVFLAYGLSKLYGKLEAVKEVNLRVKKNECFGLLGVNGAGKSTTFRMLVGEEVPTSGILCHGPDSINSNRTKYLEGIGYCPQTDALIPYFNAKEHLSLFARLRGIPEAAVASEVHSWINKLQLNKCSKNPSGCYSGGNKRRLNIAMALIAGPKMVLLDEPTTGVDPAARRSVWTVLQSCQESDQAIILTSHSMEECEALCNRLVIMVGGRILCVGASQELKERFGAGFNITIKLDPGRSDAEFIEIKNKIQAAFVCDLKDEHPGYLFYHITDSEATWVKMFGTMNDLKSRYGCIEDFTVSTSTLEQLFMQFARSQPKESHAANNQEEKV